MQDGSDAIVRLARAQRAAHVASGAPWVAVHHGGGVGMGKSIHSGAQRLADGTADGALRLERVLTRGQGSCGAPTPATTSPGGPLGRAASTADAVSSLLLDRIGRLVSFRRGTGVRHGPRAQRRPGGLVRSVLKGSPVRCGAARGRRVRPAGVRRRPHLLGLRRRPGRGVPARLAGAPYTARVASAAPCRRPGRPRPRT